MSGYEYKVVPAPTKGQKVKGARSTADRFAHALQAVMNELGADGWDYVRADTLPCEEREGLMGKTTVYQNMLVFRRAIVDPVEEPDAEIVEDAPEPLALAAPPVLVADNTDTVDADEAPKPAPPIGTIPGQPRDS